MSSVYMESCAPVELWRPECIGGAATVEAHARGVDSVIFQVVAEDSGVKDASSLSLCPGTIFTPHFPTQKWEKMFWRMSVVVMAPVMVERW